MKKKLIIYMSKLSIGGMEKALINLINLSDLNNNYDIELFLVYNTKLSYIDELPKNIKTTILWNHKWNIFGKVISIMKFILVIIKKTIYKNTYNCSICYTHHHRILSLLSRLDSKNNICFIHADLAASRNKNELKTLNRKLKFYKFSKIICVSEKAKSSFNKVFPDYRGKIYVANNYIDGENIIKLSKKKIKGINKTTFLIVARLEEESKKISRVIKCTKKLREQDYMFNVTIIGNGKDFEFYNNMIKKYDLENDIFLLGEKKNPYPYFKATESCVVASKYEGYGIVLNEARTLNVPIITTNVADASLITREGCGILCTNSEEGIYAGMKKFLDEGYTITNRFNYKDFNQKITKIINTAVEE